MKLLAARHDPARSFAVQRMFAVRSHQHGWRHQMQRFHRAGREEAERRGQQDAQGQERHRAHQYGDLGDAPVRIDLLPDGRQGRHQDLRGATRLTEVYAHGPRPTCRPFRHPVSAPKGWPSDGFHGNKAPGRSNRTKAQVAPDMFGELSICDPGPRTSTATAITDVRGRDRTATSCGRGSPTTPRSPNAYCGYWPGDCAAPTTISPT